MTRSLLVTGGAGFIGSNVVRHALSAGRFTRVVVIDDMSTGSPHRLAGLDVELHVGSILDPGALSGALAGVDSVIHLAAVPSVPRSIKDPVRSHAANATGTLALLEECRRTAVDHVVAASSSSVYGMNAELPKHERQWVRPLSPYAVSKLAAEQYTLAYQTSYELSTLALRLFNVYGPGQEADHAYAAVVPNFVAAVREGRPVTIHGDGEQSRDFTYVGTVCEVLLDAVEKRVSHPEPINLAFGSRTTLRDLVGRIERLVGREADVRHGPARPGDVRHSEADNSQLKRLFGGIVPTALDEGLHQTIAWFQQQAEVRVPRPRAPLVPRDRAPAQDEVG